jgi:hypothetical protein
MRSRRIINALSQTLKSEAGIFKLFGISTASGSERGSLSQPIDRATLATARGTDFSQRHSIPLDVIVEHRRLRADVVKRLGIL